MGDKTSERVLNVCAQRWYGVEYEVRLTLIRQSMAEREADLLTQGAGPAEEGRKRRRLGIDGWAQRLGVSHMTLRRLLRGEPVYLDSFAAIIDGLGLRFADVAQPA